MKSVILVISLAFSMAMPVNNIDIVGQHIVVKNKFQRNVYRDLPKEVPVDYYASNFWGDGELKAKIKITDTPWLFLFVEDRMDPKNSLNRIERVVTLCDHRESETYGVHRILGIIHIKRGELFYSAIDAEYIDKMLGEDKPKWKDITKNGLEYSVSIFKKTVKAIEIQEKIRKIQTI